MDEAAHVTRQMVSPKVSSPFLRWDSSPRDTIRVNPRDLDLKNRFDIIVKTVYAIFLRRGNVPAFVSDMYNRHLEVWNHFKEPCIFNGEQDWFDATKLCVTKSSAQDFQRSFANTLESIATRGFDTTQSLVPVTRTGFPLNGAHRIAAAIALGLPTMPVQRVKLHHIYTWDHAFFTKQGLEAKYADFAMSQWMRHVKNDSAADADWSLYIANGTGIHAAVVFPSTGGRFTDRIANIFTRNGIILTQRSIVFQTLDAADMFVQHLYPQEKWVANGGSRAKTKACYPQNVWTTWVLFWESSLPLPEVLSVKQEIRALFNLGKHSIHITDTATQAVEIAKMALNRNSMDMLNRMAWSTPSQRKAKRLCVPCATSEKQHCFYLDGQECVFETKDVPRDPTPVQLIMTSIQQIQQSTNLVVFKYNDMFPATLKRGDDVDVLVASVTDAVAAIRLTPFGKHVHITRLRDGTQAHVDYMAGHQIVVSLDVYEQFSFPDVSECAAPTPANVFADAVEVHSEQGWAWKHTSLEHECRLRWMEWAQWHTKRPDKTKHLNWIARHDCAAEQATAASARCGRRA